MVVFFYDNDNNANRQECKIDEIKNLVNDNVQYIYIAVTDDKEKYTYNYESLLDLKTQVIVKYGTNLDERLELQEFINYKNKLAEIKRNILDDRMTPFEKVMAVYQYAIRKPYQSYSEMGSAHNFISENGKGTICEDYCSFIKEMLVNEDFIELNKVSVSILEDNTIYPHVEILISIDDDKYNIHGVYVLDPTQDSYVEDWKNYFGDNYSPGEIFERFMMPLNSKDVYQYSHAQLRFTNGYDFETLYEITKTSNIDMLLSQTPEGLIEILKSLNTDDSDEYEEFETEIESVVKSVKNNDMYLANKIPYSQYVEALLNIMIYQGKTKEEIKESLSRIISNYKLANAKKNKDIEEINVGKLL